MSNSTRSRRTVNPVKCDCQLIQQPISHCEILPAGLPGCLAINGTVYKVEIIGHLPPAPAQPVVDGYRLTKANGEAHDVCLVAGRLECTCGDYEFVRSRLNQDCKHCAAVRATMQLPADQYEPRVVDNEVCIERCEVCGDTLGDPRGCSCVRGDEIEEELERIPPNGHGRAGGVHVVRTGPWYQVSGCGYYKGRSEAAEYIRAMKQRQWPVCDFEDL